MRSYLIETNGRRLRRNRRHLRKTKEKYSIGRRYDWDSEWYRND